MNIDLATIGLISFAAIIAIIHYLIDYFVVGIKKVSNVKFLVIIFILAFVPAIIIDRLYFNLGTNMYLIAFLVFLIFVWIVLFRIMLFNISSKALKNFLFILLFVVYLLNYIILAFIIYNCSDLFVKRNYLFVIRDNSASSNMVYVYKDNTVTAVQYIDQFGYYTFSTRFNLEYNYDTILSNINAMMAETGGARQEYNIEDYDHYLYHIKFAEKNKEYEITNKKYIQKFDLTLFFDEIDEYTTLNVIGLKT